jgi:hypothetical protein
MDAFIYFPPNLGVALDEFEDLLEDAMGEHGEVTGSGAGEKGSNFDLSIFDDKTPYDVVISWVKEAIEKSGCKRECCVDIADVRHTITFP